MFLVSHQIGVDPGHLRADHLAGVRRDPHGRDHTDEVVPEYEKYMKEKK